MSFFTLSKKSLFPLAAGVFIIVTFLVMARRPRKHREERRSGAIQVVAAENFWGDIAAQIGGSRVNVVSIMSNPNADPHLYGSDAHDAAVLAAAEVIIENGCGYDDFMDKLLSASPDDTRRVVSACEILHTAGVEANPHVWYDIARVPQVAAAIEAALVAQRPGDRDYFAQRLRHFDRSLQPVLQTIRQIKNRYPGMPVAYTERVPQYLIDAAGLADKTPEGFARAIEEGNDPSPADNQAMNALITGRRIRVLLYNAQVTSPATRRLRDMATAMGIPVVGVTETLPPNEPTYQAWQQDQAEALLKALKHP